MTGIEEAAAIGALVAEFAELGLETPKVVSEVKDLTKIIREELVQPAQNIVREVVSVAQRGKEIHKTLTMPNKKKKGVLRAEVQALKRVEQAAAGRKKKPNQKALHQAVVGLRNAEQKMAPVAVSVPMRKTYYSAKATSNGKMTCQTITVGDRLGKIKVNSSTAEGEVLFQQNLNPSLFYNTPLAVEALLWDRYHCDQVTFWYDPDCATSQNGSVIGAVDPDVKDEGGYAIGEIVNLSNFCAHDIMGQTNVWAPRSWSWKNPDPTYLYVKNEGGDEAYWNTCGIFAIVSNSEFAGSLTAGTVYFKARYTFQGRNVESAVLQSGYFHTQATAATSSKPFDTATIGPTTAVGKFSTLDLPIISDDSIKFSDLSPATVYIITLEFLAGTTCSAAPSYSIGSGQVSTSSNWKFFDSDMAIAVIAITPNAAGNIELNTVSSGTWVASPQECYITIQSTSINNNTARVL